jgi:hypothetical protein
MPHAHVVAVLLFVVCCLGCEWCVLVLCVNDEGLRVPSKVAAIIKSSASRSNQPRDRCTYASYDKKNNNNNNKTTTTITKQPRQQQQYKRTRFNASLYNSNVSTSNGARATSRPTARPPNVSVPVANRNGRDVRAHCSSSL